MKVLFVTSEVFPFIKVGGLADVSYALPIALRKLGVDIHLLIPGYKRVIDNLELSPAGMDFPFMPGSAPAHLLAGMMPDGKTPVYVLDCPPLYRREGGPYQDQWGRDWDDNALRFSLLCKAAARLSHSGPVFNPELVHCNDWPTGLTPLFLQNIEKPPASIMSIHNMAYQGVFVPDMIPQLELPWHGFNVFGYEFNGLISFLKAGLFYSDWITTVSPTYAEEIQTEIFGYGLQGLLREQRDRLSGILNGIDTTEWDPAHDSYIESPYDIDGLDKKQANKQALCRRLGLHEDMDAPLLGIVTRLTYQKGIDTLLPLIPRLIAENTRFAIVGLGDKSLELSLQELAFEYPGKISVTLGYDEELAHQVEAGADIFLMPSRFEPCGLNQMYSMRYGTLPLVRRTGGLADTVVNTTPATLDNATASGFVFEQADSEQLYQCILRALLCFRDKKTWRMIQTNAMRCDFSWDKSAQAYLSLYQNVLKAKKG